MYMLWHCLLINSTCIELTGPRCVSLFNVRITAVTKALIAGLYLRHKLEVITCWGTWFNSCNLSWSCLAIGTMLDLLQHQWLMTDACIYKRMCTPLKLTNCCVWDVFCLVIVWEHGELSLLSKVFSRDGLKRSVGIWIRGRVRLILRLSQGCSSGSTAQTVHKMLPLH